MPSALALNGKQFEKPLLEWKGSDVEVADDEVEAVVASLGAGHFFVELMRFIGLEILVLPVSIEDAGALQHERRVASLGCPDIPLEAGHLCLVRQVR